MPLAISANFDDLRFRLRRFERDQLPFAIAVTLTRTAQAAQREVRDELLEERFTLRNRWVQGGIRIRAARKRHLEAAVFSRDDFMTLHETGGVKRPRGGGFVAVPQQAVPRTGRGLIRRRARPRALDVGGDRAFFAELEDSGKPAIFALVGRGRAARPRLFYVLEDEVEIEARFGFVPRVLRVARTKLQPQFERAFAEALASARARPRRRG